MSLRFDPTEPESMTPDERRDEFTSILARRVVWLHERVLPHESLERRAEESSTARLDLSAPPHPCVGAGSRSEEGGRAWR